MAKDGYIITRSNYTEKKKHKLLSNSDIYERDYMTTTNLGGWDSDSIPYGEGNFKIVRRDVDNTKRKHKYGNWLTNDNCLETESSNCDFFTLDTLPNSEEITPETKIESKPSKNSLTDYAYYGNCEELINSSINNILANYPGELFVADHGFEYINANGEVKLLGNSEILRVVENPFNIDIVSQTNTEQGNPLYYFCDSLDKYSVIMSNGAVKKINKWEVSDRTDKKQCFNDGERLATVTLTLEGNVQIVIYQYFLGGNKFLLTAQSNEGVRIRPNQETIDGIFDKFDNFEKLLLNRDSDPLYRIELDTPTDTDYGVFVSRRSYTWPTTNEWNLDFSSEDFGRYYGSLITMARWYDENRTDNLWRNMTHEAIKNMDNTLSVPRGNEQREDYVIGKSNLRGLMQAYGRQFDDIKHDIDTIKATNTVTHNEDNNVPDYFLSDQVNISGWDVKSVVEGLNPDATSKSLFPGVDKEFKVTDANLAFLRNLKLNSRGIFARKGTKQAVEMVLSLFGYKSYDWCKKYYQTLSNSLKPKRGRTPIDFDSLPENSEFNRWDYKLNEYDVVVENEKEDIVPLIEQLDVEKYNTYKVEYNGHESTVEGLPVRLVEITMNDGSTTTTKKYIIPWFDKHETLDGDPYFQMYGGWGKRNTRKVVPNKELYPNVNSIETISGFTIYDETQKYLKVVSTLDDLVNLDPNTLNSDDIYYVDDISDIEQYDSGAVLEDATNYFIIKDVKNAYFCGEKIFHDTKNESSYYTLNTDKCTHGNHHCLGTCPTNALYGESSGDYTINNDACIRCGKCKANCDKWGIFAIELNTPKTGWKNISKRELSCEDGASPDAYRVIYLENIIEENSGNNPHVGYAKYDNGEAYLDYFRQIFKGAIDNDLFGDEAYDCSTGDILDEIKNTGFKNVRETLDNVKVWYFTDTSNENKVYPLLPNEVETTDGNTIQNGYIIDDSPIDDIVNVGKTAYQNEEVGFSSELVPFNLETQEADSNDEAAANSIINVKKLIIAPNPIHAFDEEFCDYFNNCVLPYVKQVIPSTTILEIDESGMPFIDAPFVYFVSSEDGSTVGLKQEEGSNHGMEYSYDGISWSVFEKGTPITVDNRKRLYVRGVLGDNGQNNRFTMTGKVSVCGNINAIWNYKDLNAPLKPSCGTNLFEDCLGLIDASCLVLPSMNLANYCYSLMFVSCSNLAKAPKELPATSLTYECYGHMFEGCFSLTTAPKLPATSLAPHCYGAMFGQCRNLTIAPELPAKNLASACYIAMFRGCNNLTKGPVLRARTLVSDCYEEIFLDCSNLNYVECYATGNMVGLSDWLDGVSTAQGTFVKNPQTSEATWRNFIPRNWTVVNANI